MALSVSIYLDDQDLRRIYGIEILTVDNPWGTARFASSLLDVPLRDGSILTRGKFETRRIVLKGYIKQASHAALLTALDALKTKIHPQGEGLGKVRLKFADATDRWFRGYFEDVKLGPPFKAWRITAAVNIELTFVCVEALGEGDEIDTSYFGISAGTQHLKFDNVGTAISYPLLMIDQSTGTELTIVNTAILQRVKLITSTLDGVVRRSYGHPTWSGVNANWGGIYPKTADSTMVRIPTAGNFTPKSFTFLIWVYRMFAIADNDEHFFLCNDDESLKLYYNGAGANAKIVFDLEGTTIELNDAELPHLEWTALRIAYDGQEMTFHTSRASFPSAEQGTFDTVGTYLYIGSDSSSNKQADSYLDELRIINRVISSIGLTEWEKFKNMESPMPMHKGTLAYWKFNDDANAIGWKNTSLTVTNLSAPIAVFLDCEKLTAYITDQFKFTGLTDKIADVTGEFPYLVPGLNSLLVTSDGTSSLTIRHRPRYL